MTLELTKAQLHAFLALILAVVVVSLAPVIVTGLMGRTVPDSLIAVSDKTVTGLVGVLGTLVGVMWQSRPRAPEAANDNAADAARSTAGAAKERADEIAEAA